MSDKFSRRDFIKRAGGALAALTLPHTPGGADPDDPWHLPLPPDDAAGRQGQGLGRVTTSRLRVRAAPDREAEIVGYRAFDDLLTLYGTAQGPGELAHNPLWFRVRGGYAHASFVQPVSRRLNRPLLPAHVSQEEPALLEVTMPYVDTYRQPATDTWRAYRLYYATTHWAVAVERDATKQSWYKLRNDRGHGHYYARAERLRPILPTELTPFSPDVPDKHVAINLSAQTLTAYEGDEVVLKTRVSTGTVFASDGGEPRDFRTPAGTFRVWRKRPSRHMEGGTPGVDYFNLPGVPWVCYFTGGIALHGAYWHNDFGRQRSHGCVNLTPEDARWLYRWTDPEVPADQEVLSAQAATGTLIRVMW